MFDFISIMKDVFVQSIKDRGVLKTFLVAPLYGFYLAYDRYYDLKNHTRTARYQKLTSTNIDSENIIHGNDNEPTPYLLIINLINAALNMSKENPATSTLVDYGCGYGRVLIVALNYGFGKVIGVDFSEEFCKGAEQNLKNLKLQSGTPEGKYCINCGDAVFYKIPGDANFFFFASPFDDVIMEAVANNILESYRINPRKIWILYCDSRHGHVFEKCGFKTQPNVYNPLVSYQVSSLGAP